MPAPKPPAIELAAPERQELQRLLKRHMSPQQLALRAQIVLDAADEANNPQIARQLGVSLAIWYAAGGSVGSLWGGIA
jgi:putative transposase